MTRWDEDEFTANDLLLDRELIDSRGMPAGRVDDLELTVPGPGEPPVVTALLCGPTAFGPRLGGQHAGGATMAADSRSGQLEACRGRSATWRRVLASYGTGSPIE
jgi:hypothetical protein